MNTKFIGTLAGLTLVFATLSVNAEDIPIRRIVRGDGETTSPAGFGNRQFPYLTDQGDVVGFMYYFGSDGALERYSGSGLGKTQLTPNMEMKYVACPAGSSSGALCIDWKAGYVWTGDKTGKYIYYQFEDTFYGQDPEPKVIYRHVNNGPLESNVLYDYTNDAFNSLLYMQVNSSGSAIIQANNLSPNPQIEFAHLTKDGVKKTLLVTSRAGFESNIAINDLDTSFIALENRTNENVDSYDLIAIQPDGTQKTVGQSWQYRFLSTSMYASSKTTDEHPEGLLYYLQSNQKLVSTDGRTIADFSDTSHYMNEFRMNENEQFVFSEETYGGPGFPVSNVYYGPNATPLVGTGSKVDGAEVGYVYPLSINSKGEVLLFIAFQDHTYGFYTATLQSNLCKVADKGRIVKFWSQTQSPWGADQYATINKKMSSKGCFTTSMAMLFDSYGINVTTDGSPLDPGTLNRSMQNNALSEFHSKIRAYTPEGDVNPPGTVNIVREGVFNECMQNSSTPDRDYCHNLAKSSVSFKDSSLTQNESLYKKVETEICNGNPVILAMNRKSGKGYHFVLATGVDLDSKGNKTFIVNDPGSGRGEGTNISVGRFADRYPEIAGIRLFRPAADPSMIYINSSNNVHFILSDPQGRRVGFNPKYDLKFSEIPKSSYETESIGSPLEDGIEDDSTVPENIAVLPSDVLDGPYSLQIYGVTPGNYSVEISHFDIDGYLNDVDDFSGTINAGEVRTLAFAHSGAKLPYFNANLSIKEITVSNIRNPSQSIAIFRGTISPRTMKAIPFRQKFSITVGGITGPRFEIPISMFKFISNGKNSFYLTDGNGPASVHLSSSGEFEIKIKSPEISTVPDAKKGEIIVQVDDLAGPANLKMKCQGSTCLGQ